MLLRFYGRIKGDSSRLEILLVDDDTGRQDRICRQLSAKGHNIYIAADKAYAVQMLRNGCSPQVILFNGQATGMSMETFLEALIQFAPMAKIYAMPSNGMFESEMPPDSIATPEQIAISLAAAIGEAELLMSSLRKGSDELRDMVAGSKTNREARRQRRKATKP
jgi:CheY-like chemotaxis protein